MVPSCTVVASASASTQIPGVAIARAHGGTSTVCGESLAPLRTKKSTQRSYTKDFFTTTEIPNIQELLKIPRKRTQKLQKRETSVFE
eukprot:4690616-Amphidinium_carterae.1